MSRRIRIAGGIAFGFALTAVGVAVADEIKEEELRKRLGTGESKRMVEAPLKRGLKAPVPQPPNAPPAVIQLDEEQARRMILSGMSKTGVELPVRNALTANLYKPVAGKERVQPGRVVWHADFDAARRAARKSGKPVLLFQLLGRLDEAFC